MTSIIEAPYIAPANGMTYDIQPANGVARNGMARGPGIKRVTWSLPDLKHKVRACLHLINHSIVLCDLSCRS